MPFLTACLLIISKKNTTSLTFNTYRPSIFVRIVHQVQPNQSATVAQWIRHRPPTVIWRQPGIAGSSPAGGCCFYYK